MVITAIKRQLGNTGRVSVFLDGKYAFSLTIDQLADEKLKSGQIISEEELVALKKLSIIGKIRTQVIEWLIVRPRSDQELRAYLVKKNLESEFCNSLIEEMQNMGLQDNLKYALWLTHSRHKKFKSNLYIAKELKSKGIDDDIIKSVLVEGESVQQDKLKSLIVKKSKLKRYQDQNKLIRYLMQLGYSFSDVKAALADD